MKVFQRRRLARAMVLIGAGSMAGHSLAQQIQLEEVIVTAQKKVETLQTVPMTINVVTGEVIRDYNLFDFKDIQSVTPGLVIQPQDSRTATVSLRGVDVNNDSGFTAAIAIYWNELNYRIDHAFTSMFDIGQIEVLRGPQGTLRGVTAPAGAITIATQGPNYYNIDGSIQQTIGEHELTNTQIAASLPIVEGKFAIRVAGIYDENKNDQIENVITGKKNVSRTDGGRITFGFQPTDDLSIKLIHQYVETFRSGDRGVFGCGLGNVSLCLRPEDRKSVYAGDVMQKYRQQDNVLTVNWSVGDYEFVSVTGYLDSRIESTKNNDWGNAWPSTNTNPGFEQSDMRLDQSVATSIYEFSQEFRFSSADDEFYNWTYGVYANRVTANTTVDNATGYHLYNLFIPPATIIPGDFGYRVESTLVSLQNRVETYAAFTNHSLQFTERLEGQIGMRWQTGRASTAQDTLPFFMDMPVEVPSSKLKQDDSAVTGTASLSYEFTPDMRVYLVYGRSWRAGGYTTAPTAPIELTTYDPETSDSLELGFKSRMLDGRLQFNAAIYEQRYTDFQGRDGVRSTNRNGSISDDFLAFNADGRVRGIETQLDVLLTPDWLAGLAISYTDAKYTDGDVYCNREDSSGIIITPTPDEVVFTCPASGRLGNAANWGVSASSEYTWRMSAMDVFARGLYSFVGGRDNDVDNGMGGDSSYGVFNAYLGLRDKNARWEVSLWAKNLFDNTARIGESDFGSLGSTPVDMAGGFAGPLPPNPELETGYAQVLLLPERQIGLTAKYNFEL